MAVQKWGIIVPEATRNYVKNPRMYYDLTNWSTYNSGTATGTITRDSGWSTRSGFSSKAVKTGGSGFHGQYLDDSAGDVVIPPGLGSGDAITVSMDVHIATSHTATLTIVSGAAGADSVAEDIVGPFEGRVDLTLTLTGVPTVLQIRLTNKLAGENFTWYLDAVQAEEKEYVTTFCDGYTPNCTFAGEINDSPSDRKSTNRGGGREFNLDDFEVYVTSPTGTGFPPIAHYVQGLALLDGALYRGEKVNPAVIQLVVGIDGSTLENLHSLRKDLINVIKPDVVPGTQPIRLFYTGANSLKKIWIDVQYDSGLEPADFGGTFTDEISLRLIAYNPLWYEENWEAFVLTTFGQVSTVYNCLAKEDDSWNNLGAGATTWDCFTVEDIKKGPDGKIYIAGQYLMDYGGPAYVGIIAYDPYTQVASPLGSGITQGTWSDTITDMTWDAAGNLYVCGDFPGAVGVANTKNIAMWDGTVWISIYSTNAPSDTIDSIAISPVDGKLYVVGHFLGGIGASTQDLFSVYDPVTGVWSRLGTSPGDDFVNTGGLVTIAIDNKGIIYVGGLFASVGGNTRNNIAFWDPGDTTSGWQEMEGGSVGTNASVRKIISGNDGYIYAAGYFDSIGGDTENTAGIAKWTNSSWISLDRGLTSVSSGSLSIVDMEQAEDGSVIVGGNFDIISEVSVLGKIAIWSGSKWSGFDVRPASGSFYNNYAVLYDSVRKNLYMGGYYNSGAVTTAEVSSKNIITTSGTRESFPKIHIRRSGGTSLSLRWLKNATSGATLKFNYDLQDGEELVIDLTPGNRSIISSIWGARWDAIDQVSNVHAFSLLPGKNIIEIFALAEGTPTIECFMETIPNHWSFDGVAS